MSQSVLLTWRDAQSPRESSRDRPWIIPGQAFIRRTIAAPSRDLSLDRFAYFARGEDNQDRTSGSGAHERGDPKVVGSNPTGPATLSPRPSSSCRHIQYGGRMR